MNAPARTKQTTMAKPTTTFRTPWTSDRRRAWLTWVVIAAALLIGMAQTGMAPSRLVQSWEPISNLASRMWPPTFVEWPRYVAVLADTVYMTIAGTALALVLSIPIAVLSASNTGYPQPLRYLANGIIVLTRSIPDLVWALIFVRAVGLGTFAGVLALGVNSIGMLGKFYADALEDVDPQPVDALRASGCGRLQVVIGGMLPQAMPSWTSLLLYRFDINVRGAAILGYVGAGGIGLELQRVLGQLAYPRALAIVAVIFVLIVITEFVSNTIRRLILGDDDPHPANPFGFRAWFKRRQGVARQSLSPSPRSESARTLEERETPPHLTAASRPVHLKEPWTPARRKRWAMALGGVAAAVWSAVQLDLSFMRFVRSVPAIFGFVVDMFPPDFSNPQGILVPFAETFWMAVVATVLGMAISLPVAILGARNASPGRTTTAAARGLMLVERGIPELIMAVFFVVAVGLGPFAGVLALTFGAIGFSGKLIADAIEDMPLRAIDDGLRATGMTWLQRTFAGTLPAATPRIIGTALFTLDVNIRAAAVVGIVGAGGIGASLMGSMETRRFDRTLGIILVVFVGIYAVERLSNWLRLQLLGST